ncbi:MAG TPA: riboflavin biosynthesis protein RibD, partial [Pirellulales bacterium]|nr:riboflavin biosynthesis protein RibD [Pirellulales bacterium]
GATLLGNCFDQCLIDEAHAFMTPKLIGGSGAPSPVAGWGVADVADAQALDSPEFEILDGDFYVQGRLRSRNVD